MGEKRASVRTLDNGDKVTHYPDGQQVLTPRNRLGEQLAAEDAEATYLWLNAEKTHKRVTAVEDKRASQIAGDEVPADKRVL